LELNLATEILNLLRNQWGFPKAYLRGLTQREEKQEGVDFFAQLNPQARLFAFQFKAPRGKSEATPYRFSLIREQHEALFTLAQLTANSVFYVFPYYVTTAKLQEDVPTLITDTWLLDIKQMPTAQIFGTTNSKIVRCEGNKAEINPEYGMHRPEDVALRAAIAGAGVTAPEFARWYSQFQLSLPVGRRSPWPKRGLRIAIALP
jgi:hypothetical protein